MGTNNNIGQDNAVTVFGNPESFKKLIKNHGQLCKVKQSLVCPCAADNSGSPDMHCEVCGGDGYVFTYQRKFLVTDEQSKACKNKIIPFWTPILGVRGVQNVTSSVQGGITDLEVLSFSETEITLAEETNSYEKKRVTYYFDGWTYVASDKLDVDTINGIMYATETKFDAGYQSSNPLEAYADIAKVVKIWNIDSGIEITDYEVYGNEIKTSQPIVANKMYAEYYYSDLTQVITTDLVTRNNNEDFTHILTSGETKMAFYPFWDIAQGDIIVVSATVSYRTETVTHLKDFDRLWEIEIFELNDTIIDSEGNTYALGNDYVLSGRHIKWIGSTKPAVGKTISVRYGFKPSFIVFEDNPQPNNLENKQYPKMVLVKSWSKISKDELKGLINV